jgi:hypothetical protein
MAQFIKYTEDTGMGQVTKYINVEQVASAQYDQDSRVLRITVVGQAQEMEVHGEEAEAALKLLEQFT